LERPLGDLAVSFTERAYVELLDRAAEGHLFEPFGTTETRPHVLWRHDIDISPHRAARLARLEAERGLRATYFVHLHSWFYNAFEASCRDLLVGIAADHDIGLHFETSFYGDASPVENLATERETLCRLVGAPVRSFAFHNIGTGNPWTAPIYAGLVNAYGLTGYAYASDSNGFWRHGQPDFDQPRLQVLTHAEWWTPVEMPPRQRVQRAIDGRAAKTARLYDEFIYAHGR
jgi:hypothetical protein